MYEITLDIQKGGFQAVLEGFRVGDANARELCVRLCEGRRPYKLPVKTNENGETIANYIATLYIKGRSAVHYSSCDAYPDRVQHLFLSEEIESGISECEIRIVSEGITLTSAKFKIVSTDVLQDDDAIEAKNTFNALSVALGRVLDAEGDVAKTLSAAEDAALSAENANQAAIAAENAADAARQAVFAAVEAIEAKADKAELEKKAGAAEVGERFEVIEEVLEELIAHEHIKFTVLQVSASAVEIGSSINVNIHAVTDREAAQIEIYNGTELLYSAEDSSVADTIISGVSSDTVISVVATDEFGHDTVNERAISFCNGVYTGAGTGGTMISDLNKTLRADRKVTFTVTAGDGEYIYYACPAAMGTPSFYVGGIEGGFELVSSGEYTNTYGYTENYQVWRSVNTDLGTIKVEVK